MNNSSDVPAGKGETVKVGITHGDINGIGYEVIIKTFLDQRMLDFCTPILYGSPKVASYHRKTIKATDFNFYPVRNVAQASDSRANIINVYDQEARIDLGKSTNIAGTLSFISLQAAVNDLREGHFHALVTAPINKQNIQSERFDFPGHTEYLARQFNSSDALMLMVSEQMRIGVVTGHIPLSKVSETITKERILKKLKVIDYSLRRDFAIARPRIAVMGLNPHAGDEGLLGEEDQSIVTPAIEEAKEMGIMALGPYPADGFFGTMQFRKFDGVLAMYHDQGLVPFKTMSFHNGVNYTAGLPIVRTSPGHGTGFDIAGKNQASPEAFREAIILAVNIYKNRMEWDKLHENQLKENIMAKKTDLTEDEDLPQEKEDSNNIY